MEGILRRPVIIVADDVQWFDLLTKELLRALCDSAVSGGAAIRIVLAYRADASPPVHTLPDERTLRVPPLSQRERHDLLKALTPTTEFMPEIRKVILSRATGNPLFLEEMTRLAHECTLNNSNMNGEALTAHIIDIIPVSLHDLIQSRIDRLDSRRRQVLQCASLLGLEFALGLIEMFESLRDGLSGHLQALRAMQYLSQLPHAHELRYYFTHGLFRDVAYSMLLDDQKRSLHAALARQLEHAFSDRLQEYHELLAFHYARGDEPRKALYYHVKAGDRQAGLGAGDTALESYHDAIELIRSLPPTPGSQILMARVLLRCGRLQRTLGQGVDADESLAGALECAHAAHNERLALEARLEQAITAIWRGETEEAETVLQVMVPEAARLGSHVLEVIALNALGTLHYQRGNLWNPALAAYHAIVAKEGEVDAPQVVADALNNAGLVYWCWGQRSEALRAFKRALSLRKKAGDMFGLSATLMNIGMIQEQMGAVGAARKSYANADLLASRTGYVQAQSCIATNLSNLERCTGDPASAVRRGRRALEYAEVAGDPALEAVAHENIAQALAEQGQLTEAGTHYRRALDIALVHRLEGRELSARTGLLEVGIAATPPDEGFVTAINAVLERALAGNHVDLVPRVYRAKGLGLAHSGGQDMWTAEEYLTMARELSRASGHLFDEIAALRALVHWAGLTGRAREKEEFSRDLYALEGLLKP